MSLPDRPLLACEFAAVLGDDIRLIVAPLGQAMLNAKVAAIETCPRLRVPDPGPHRRRQDQRPWPWARGGLCRDRLRGQAAGAGRAADRRGRSLILPRVEDGRLRLVHDCSGGSRR